MANQGNGSAPVRRISPFRDSVREYRKQGWGGTIPLPPKEKHPPPPKFTGHSAKYPTGEEIKEWLAEPAKRLANIGIRLAGVDEEFELIGIDVDHYSSGKGANAKSKKGFDQLTALENKFGKLPNTWVSSSRGDGKSGIRYFRIPRGLAFSGKAAKDIDILYKGYRYAVVWPSIHPEGGIYTWYRPGESPDGNSGWTYETDGLPDARSLPKLPDKWVDYLSQGRMEADTSSRPMDMDSSVDDIYSWADFHFNQGEGGMCQRVAKSIVQCRKDILNDATSHDKIVDAHYHLFRLAAEGHVGWLTAINFVDSVWADDVIKRNKRGHAEMNAELWRSRINALRKIKAQVDQNIGLGMQGVPDVCACRGALVGVDGSVVAQGVSRKGRGTDTGAADIGEPVIDDQGHVILKLKQVKRDDNGEIIEDDYDEIILGSSGNDSVGDPGNVIAFPGGNSGAGSSGVGGASDLVNSFIGDPDDPLADYYDVDDGSGDGLESVLRGRPKMPNEYEQSDRGNAQHLCDLFTSETEGLLLRFADGLGWLIWDSGIEGGNSLDDMPHWIKDEQEILIRRAWYMVQRRQKAYAKKLWEDYQTQLASAVLNGNVTAAGAPLPGSTLADEKKMALGWREFAVRSGNNRQAEEAIAAAKKVRGVSIDINELDANPNLLGVANGVVVMSNEGAFLRDAQPEDYITINTGVEYTEYSEVHSLARDLWEKTLDLFIPNLDIRRCFKVAMGHALFGGNPEKALLVLWGETNTGKSTMINSFEAALGEYAMSVNQNLFIEDKFNSVLVNALPKRMVVCSEFDSKQKLSASQIKRITGGSDKITQEIKYSNASISRVPQFIPVIATNEVPEIDGADKALEQRLMAFPFRETPEVINKQATALLEKTCDKAILSWLVEGYIEYKRIGKLPTCPEILDVNKEFMAEAGDDVAVFVHEWIKRHDNPMCKDEDWVMTRSEMHAHYRNFCVQNEIRDSNMLSAHALTKALKRIGIRGTESNKMERINGSTPSRFWYGVRTGKAKEKVVDLKKFKPKPVDKSEDGGKEDGG